MKLKALLKYAEENATDVADLVAIDKIKTLESSDPWRKVLVKEIRNKYEDGAIRADRDSLFSQ